MTNALFVPSKAKYQSHIERVFSGGVGEKAMCDFALANNLSIFAIGDAGTGKTELGYWYASLTGRKVAVIQCNGMTTVDDILGTNVMHPETGKPVFQLSDFAKAIQEGNAVVIIDEVFKLKAQVQSSLHSLLDDRRCLFITNKFGEMRIDAHPDTLIIASGNPDYRGDSPLNEAFRDRFGIKVKYGYNKDIESKILGVPTLLGMMNRMRSMSTLTTYASEGVAFESSPITLRMGMAFKTLAQGLNFDFAVESFVNNFAPEEQDAVKNLFEIDSYQIKVELGLIDDNIKTDMGDE